jgi:hypothetical protein
MDAIPKLARYIHWLYGTAPTMMVHNVLDLVWSKEGGIQGDLAGGVLHDVGVQVTLEQVAGTVALAMAKAEDTTSTVTFVAFRDDIYTVSTAVDAKAINVLLEETLWDDLHVRTDPKKHKIYIPEKGFDGTREFAAAYHALQSEFTEKLEKTDLVGEALVAAKNTIVNKRGHRRCCLYSRILTHGTNQISQLYTTR